MMHTGAKEQAVAEPEVVGGAAAEDGRPRLAPVGQPVPPSFDELYQREWSGLVALAWSLTGSWSAAEELAQDAFADAYRRWDEVGGMDKPGGWVRRAIVNRAASHHRHRRVEDRPAPRLLAADDRPDPTGDGAADRVGDPAFWSAIRALPERQAACVALHYLEDRSVAEIAEILDCRPSTVKVHLHRGRQTLARTLDALTGPNPAEGER